MEDHLLIKKKGKQLEKPKVTSTEHAVQHLNPVLIPRVPPLPKKTIAFADDFKTK
jgi:hypothetical protein